MTFRPRLLPRATRIPKSQIRSMTWWSAFPLAPTWTCSPASSAWVGIRLGMKLLTWGRPCPQGVFWEPVMANFGRPEPRFDIDFSYGNVGERLRETHYAWIMDGSGKVEVKRNRYLDLHLYVEQSCNKGRGGCYEPSGINVTEA